MEKEKGGNIYIVRLKKVALDVMESGDYLDKIGRDCFFDSKTTVFAEMYRGLDPGICQQCPFRVFLECEHDPKLPKIMS
ncbi:MAG: hypothetical protein IPL65_14810 [Lewinellaceae bacterium]|nr:hypothetical protein [Lewinellaceae bacterium]